MRSDLLAKRTFLFLWLFFIALIIKHSDLFEPLSYTSWTVSDWLINYEGGFVRRGLIGQLIYFIYMVHPFPVIHFLKVVYALGSVFFVMLLMYVFKSEGWSLSILPLWCVGGVTLFNSFCRRDLWLLMVVYFMFLMLRNYLRTRKRKFLVVLWFLSVFAILSHESTFFYSYPIMMVYAWIACLGKQRIAAKPLLKYLLIFIPGIITMAFVCHYKGDADTAKAIWASWADLFKTYPDGIFSFPQTRSMVGAGVNALSWETLETMKFHLSYNFVVANTTYYLFEGFSLLKFLSTTSIMLLMFASIYCLTTHLNTIAISLWPVAGDQFRRICKTLSLQLLFMLPMFTVLSVDIPRTLPYWVVSSLFAIHCLGELKSSRMDQIVDKIAKIFDARVFQSPWMYILIAILSFIFPPARIKMAMIIGWIVG